MATNMQAALAGADGDQVAMMEEKVILVNEQDEVIGAESKKVSHLLEEIDAGMLHRAFSVFLFTPEGKLVLQQRAASKITFPAYWANTCCSHPLHIPSELELTNALGVKRAARRKLAQELGIPQEDVPLSAFEFVSRIHYGAPANDPDNMWAEHEIDHILICRPPTMPRIAPNPNEVQATAAFTPTELAEWVNSAEERGELIAPWFKCMERTLLYRWWTAAMQDDLDSIKEPDMIHRYGRPPYTFPAHDTVLPHAQTAEAAMAGYEPPAAASPAAAAAQTDAVGDASKKQGAYGRVHTFSWSIANQLAHVDEVWQALKFKTGQSHMAKVQKLPADACSEQVWCEDMLTRVSRSFAMVIQQLSPRLRASVCVFYLVLRGLDTVEDDMEAFVGNEEEKLAHLRSFYTYLDVPSWAMRGVGAGDEALLLEEFGQVVRMYMRLEEDDRAVVADITRRMGEGMADFVSRDLRDGTRDDADYNLYCHYVAGLVGEGLSRLFAATGLEDPRLAQETVMANDMGLFLQKTNIIRDYLEDLVEGRAFWPRSIWEQYVENLWELRGRNGPSAAATSASTGEPAGDPALPHQPHPKSLACLNHMIANALQHLPQCLRYLSVLKSDDVFRFCAIPQVMAIASLRALANNPKTFAGVVKIRKGQALLLIEQCSSKAQVYTNMLKLARETVAAIPSHHVVAHSLAHSALAEVEDFVLPRLPMGSLTTAFSGRAVAVVALVFARTLMYLQERSKHWSGYMPRITDSWDVAVLTLGVACALYLLIFTGVPIITAVSDTAAYEDNWTDSAVDVTSKAVAAAKAPASPAREPGQLRHRAVKA